MRYPILNKLFQHQFAGSKSNDFFTLITGQAHRFNIYNQWIGTVKPGKKRSFDDPTFIFLLQHVPNS